MSAGAYVFGALRAYAYQDLALLPGRDPSYPLETAGWSVAPLFTHSGVREPVGRPMESRTSAGAGYDADKRRNRPTVR